MQVAITGDGGIETSKVDKFGITLELKKFKTDKGKIDYPALFSIPPEQRIEGMSKVDLNMTMKTITVAVTMALETMNLSRPMQAFQILDLAEAIVDSASEEDKPSLPDLMLFLQKLTRGEYPGLYEGIDIPKFMERWSQYRDERWEEGIKIRDEKEKEFKEMGDRQSFDRDNPKATTVFGEHLKSYNTKLQARNDEIRALRAEQKRNRR